MRRLLAVVVAIALIGGAYVYRTGDSDDSGGGGGRSSDGPLTLVCTTELAEICQAVEESDPRVRLTVEPAWRTVERLLEDVPEVPDAWLSAGPWPQLVDEERGRRNLNALFDSTEALAGTSLVAVVDTQKLSQLPCASDPTWACLAGAATGAGQATRLRLGMPSPTAEAAGTLVIAATVGSAVGESEYSLLDFEGLPPEALAIGTANAVEAAARSGGNSAELFFGGSGGAFLDAWAGTAAELASTLESAVRRSALTVVEPNPRAVVTATLGVTRDVEIEDLADALREGGWDQPAPDAASDGLPSPGVLVALSEVIR